MRAPIKLKLGGTIRSASDPAMAVTIVLGVSRPTTLNDAIGEVITGPAAQLDRARAIDGGVSMMIRAEKNLILAKDAADRREFEGRSPAIAARSTT